MKKKIIIAKNRPNIGVFIQGAYGNPGLNLLKNESTPFFIAGIGLKWNIGNFYTLRNELRINKSKQLQLNIQKDLFLLNTELEIIKEDNDIKEISNKIQKNQEIIVLRKEIREITEDKLINGMASVNDLIETIISEESAIQDKIISEINFLIYIYMRKQTINY
ncbi:TolC family protein [Bacteroides thetaiotaomicron]|uniref:TolC family protein n=1 Tax=Bacteroides thetaiotaomicron TaxID=818 RepID=UPI0039C46095